MSYSHEKLQRELDAHAKAIDDAMATFHHSFLSIPSSQPTPVHVHSHTTTHASRRAKTTLASGIEEFQRLVGRRPLDMVNAARLIASGVDRNTQSVFGKNLLHAAIESQNTDSIKEALRLGVNPNTKNIFDNSPLAMVIGKTPLDMDAAEAIIKAGGDPNSQTTFAKSLLHVAVESRNLDHVKKALSLGVSPRLKDNFDKTALDRAISSFPAAVPYLQAGPAVIQTSSRTHAFASVTSVPVTRPLLQSPVPAKPVVHSAPPYRAPVNTAFPPKFDLNTLTNRPESGKLICEHIDKNSLTFVDLEFLSKSQNARSLVIAHINTLDDAEKLRLVIKCQDTSKGLGYFFSVKKNIFEFTNPYTERLVQMRSDCEARLAKAAMPSSTPSSSAIPGSYAVMYPVLGNQPGSSVLVEASAPPEEDVELSTYIQKTDAFGGPFMPEFDFVKEEAATTVAVPAPVVQKQPGPEDELPYDEVPDTNTANPRL